MIELLLDRGASPEMETAVGETCLDFALRAEASAAFLIRTCPELLEARSRTPLPPAIRISTITKTTPSTTKTLR